MELAINPFRPGAGRRPPALTGRGDLLEAFGVVVERAERFGEGDRSWVLNGLRGMGKTALLREMLGYVESRSWIAAVVEGGASESLPVALVTALTRAMRTATGRHPESRLRRLLSVFTAFSLAVDPSGSVSLGVDVEPAAGTADSGRFADDLTELFEVLGQTARDLGIGVLILVDELQEAAKKDLRALNVAVHQNGQADVPLPVVVVGAGLPSLPAVLADATSYAERLYDHRTIGFLDDAGSSDALTMPTAALDVTWADDALALALENAQNYPYLLQAVGKHVWDSARSGPIKVDDVQAGLVGARREVDEGLYRSRWERATPAQRELLRALASVGGAHEAPVAEIARALGRRTSDISAARKDVLAKGLVHAPERGMLAFTVPGMHEFIARQG